MDIQDPPVYQWHFIMRLKRGELNGGIQLLQLQAEPGLWWAAMYLFIEK